MYSKQSLEYQKKLTVTVNYFQSTEAAKEQVTLREFGAVSVVICLLTMNLKLMALPFTHLIGVSIEECS